jgi:hypothetical protein
MCAPGDQRKSSNNQYEQAELNALRCRWELMLNCRSICSSTAELRAALGYEGDDSLLRIIRAAGRYDRVVFSFELI